MSKNSKKSSQKATKTIIRYPKQYHFSIGMIVIGVMCVYMVYHLFTYLTSNNVTIYEVSQGSISSNLEYNALAIRQEQIVYADNTGDILYLSENFGKVGAKSQVYALDTSGEILSSIEEANENAEVTFFGDLVDSRQIEKNNVQ